MPLLPQYGAMLQMNFSNNEIENIPKWHFKNFTKLNSMDLSRNRIERLAPGTFSENKNLKFLSLEKNNFKTIPIKQFRILGKAII